MPSFDRISQRWLARSRSPYVDEIAAIAGALDFSGVWLLNASMQWGCTSRASAHDGVPWLLRTLDWPFHCSGPPRRSPTYTANTERFGGFVQASYQFATQP